MNPTHRQRLIKNQVAFVQDLQVDDTFIAVMKAQEILTEGMIEEILSKPTSQKKATAFMSVISRRGPKAFQVLVDALMESGQTHLAELLDRKMTEQWKRDHPHGRRKPQVNAIRPSAPPYPAYIPAPPASHHKHPERFGDEEEESFLPVHQIQFVNPADSYISHLLNDSQLAYKMSSKPRGRAVILNNEHFVHLGERLGSQFDAVNLSELFKKLGFETVLWNNLSAEEITTKINAERKRESHQTSDAFIFVALSHGNKGLIYGIDGRREDLGKDGYKCHGSVSIEKNIMAMFDGINCPQLVGRPKMFFIQACQGDIITRGSIQADDDSMDANPINEVSMENKLIDEKDALPALPTTHEKADMLIASSTVSGYKSWRHPNLGSWFMRDLVETCIRSAHIEDVLSMMTQINSRISDRHVRYKGYLQISEVRHTLRKKVFFFPGYYET